MDKLIGSSTEHCKKELLIHTQEYQLRLHKEQHAKVNDDLETQSRKLKLLLHQRLVLYFKLQEKGWDYTRIVQFHPDLILRTLRDN